MAAASAMVASAVVLGTATPAAAESLLWSLIASPLTATTGVSTTFTLTGTNEDPLVALDSSREIGCMVLDVPGNFAVHGTAVVSASGVRVAKWIAGASGNTVTVQTTSGGDRLALLESITFEVTATPLAAGSLNWEATAYRDQGCSGSGAVLGVPPVVLVVGALVTPTPLPTPTLSPISTPTLSPISTPTLSPISTPTLSPLPTPTLPPLSTPKLTPEPAPLPEPDEPAPLPTASLPDAPTISNPSGPDGPRTLDDGAGTASPTASPSPAPDDRPREAGAAVAPRSGAGPTAPGGSSSAGTRILARPVGGEEGGGPQAVPVGLGALGLLGSVDVWIVPGLLLGFPGLLVVLAVLLQGAGALVWVPAIRRLRGDPSAHPAG